MASFAILLYSYECFYNVYSQSMFKSGVPLFYEIVIFWWMIVNVYGLFKYHRNIILESCGKKNSFRHQSLHYLQESRHRIILLLYYFENDNWDKALIATNNPTGEEENNASFYFDDWLTKPKLQHIKQLFVEYNMCTEETLSCNHVY